MGSSAIFSPIALPCGRIIQNRLVKVSLYEHFASLLGGPPNKYHFALYSNWSQYDWGMVLTGNVIVSASHLTLGRDMVIPDVISEETLRPFKALAFSIHHGAPRNQHDSSSHQTIAIMQLSHAGRQSANLIGGRLPFIPPLAPSAVPIGTRRGGRDEGVVSRVIHSLLFQTPRPMSLLEIDEVVESFTRGASLAFQAGFDGIQLHVAHGYLLAQFMSEKTNRRKDAYSSDSAGALLLLHRIITSIRRVVPKNFILGVKLNSSDYLDSKSAADKFLQDIQQKQEERALNHIRTISEWRNIDFIEISGGDYEQPDFMSNSGPESSRQAFFARFSRRVVQLLEPSPSNPTHLPLVLLTGGLRTPAQLHMALSSRHAHLLGIGRASILCPHLPQLLLQSERTNSHKNDISDAIPFSREPNLDISSTILRFWPLTLFWDWIPKIRLIGAGVEMAWYTLMMRRLAIGVLDSASQKRMKRKDKVPDYGVGGIEAVIRMWLWRNRVSSRTFSWLTLSIAFVAVCSFLYIWSNLLLD